MKTHLRTVLFLLLISGLPVQSTLIFSDDFSNPALSDLNWSANMPNYVTLGYSDDKLTIKNNHHNYSGLVTHALPSSDKRDTFTLSVDMIGDPHNSSGMGVMFCLQGAGLIEGYGLHVQGNLLYVRKYTGSENGVIFQKNSGYINQDRNEFKISKGGSDFYIFVNGELEGTFTDSQYESGDIAFMVPPSSELVVDRVKKEHVFDIGESRSSFVTSFDGDGTLAGWTRLGDPTTEVTEEDNVLKVQTSSSTDGFYYSVNVDVENFVARTVVSHRKGDNRSFYGLFLMGYSGENISVACFGVNGSRNYATFLPDGSTFIPSPSTRVRGAALVHDGETYYYQDTLEIYKAEGSAEYVFRINGKPLSRFTNVQFDISGVGIFAYEDLELQFDYFGVAEGEELPNTSIINRPVVRREFLIEKRDMGTFDLRGRKVNTTPGSGFIREAPRSSGMYLNDKDGKKIIIR
ncbi:hypothetical protein CHISP_0224 [Chitinispirillum alkaliphilum]|nr:hypothetical protein CHISP_0224 [Chitinispirillum alkaliphilum]